MAFTATKQYANNFNSGNEYENGNSLSAETINGLINGLLYAQENADTLGANVNSAISQKADKSTVNSLQATVNSHTSSISTLQANVNTLSSNQLPAVTSSNNGQFLRVANGKWTATTVESAENTSF